MAVDIVAVGDGDDVGLGSVGEGVRVGIVVGVRVGTRVRVAVGVGVLDGECVGVCVGVAVGCVAVAVCVGVDLAMAVSGGVGVWVMYTMRSWTASNVASRSICRRIWDSTT